MDEYNFDAKTGSEAHLLNRPSFLLIRLQDLQERLVRFRLADEAVLDLVNVVDGVVELHRWASGLSLSGGLRRRGGGLLCLSRTRSGHLVRKDRGSDGSRCAGSRSAAGRREILEVGGSGGSSARSDGSGSVGLGVGGGGLCLLASELSAGSHAHRGGDGDGGDAGSGVLGGGALDTVTGREEGVEALDETGVTTEEGGDL
jgi:hypothetical protein